MPPEAHRVSALTLAREEIRTLPRQTFALGAIAFVLALLVPLAAAAIEGASGMQDYLMFMWVVGELLVAIVLAARIASARRTRFVDSLYTTPLEPRSWLMAQMLVGAFLAALILLAQLPLILVHLVFVGVPAGFLGILLAALGVAAFAIAFGTFCGVIVGNAGPGAAAGLTGGFGFVSFFALILHAMASSGPPSPTGVLLLRITALSPLALVVDAAGVDIFGSAPDDLWRPMVGLAALILGLGGAAWIAYTRAQGPLGWEPKGSRALIVALVALAIVVPVATASVNYHEVEDGPSHITMHGEYTRLAFVPRGTEISDDEFTLRAPWDWEDLTHGADNELDLLVMILAPAGETVRNVHIQVTGSDELSVVSGGQRTVASGEPDGQARRGESYDEDEEPTGPFRPVYRVPLTLRPLGGQALQDAPGLLEVDTTFVMDGRALESNARVTLEANRPGAHLALLLAGTPLPLVALGALVTRRLHTR